jgi:hypothetical protein
MTTTRIDGMSPAAQLQATVSRSGTDAGATRKVNGSLAGLAVVACTRKESELKPALLDHLRRAPTENVAIPKNLWRSATARTSASLEPKFMRVLADA